MKKIGRRFLLTAAVLALLRADAISDVSVSASIDKTKIALNDSARVSVVISGNASNLPSPQLPDLSAFSVYSSGRSQNVSFVNGQVSSSVNYTYTLAPKSAGKFVIGPFSIAMDGKTVQSAPLELEVLGAGLSQPSSPAAAPQSQAQAPGAFVKMGLDKSTAYVNEQVILTFRFYHRIRLISNPSYQPPETTGFVFEDLPPPRNFIDSAHGAQYNVTEIKTALFPTKPGALTLSPASLRIQVQDLGGDPFSDDFFEHFFRGGGREYLLKTDPARLTVLPLPASGKPADFSGGVGEFGIALELDKRKAAVGEPLTLTLTINGKGNIKSLGDPAFPEFSGFRKYDTASSLNIDKSQGEVAGSKVYKIVLVPQTSGAHSIPSIRFSYFHLPSKTYKTITTQSFAIEVTPGKPQSFVISPGMAPQITNVAKDIRYIKQDPERLRDFAWFNKSPIFFYLHLLPALGVFSGLAFRVRLFLARRNPERRRKEGALKKWESALRTIGLDDANSAGDVFRAFQGYFSDKMLESEPSLSLSGVQAFLKQNNADDSLIERVKEIWNQFEVSRYAPAQFRRQDVRRLTDEAKKLVAEIDPKLKKNGTRLKTAAALLIPFLFISFSGAEGPKDIFKEANAQYQSGQFERAKSLYQALRNEYGESFVLEYNLGNAHYKLGRTGLAIAHWMRAYRMNPGDADVRANLELACALTGEPFEPEAFFLRLLSRGFTGVNLNTLSILYLIAFWALGIYWTMILFSKAPFIAARTGSSTVIFALIFFWWAARLRQEQFKTHAVVRGANAEVRSGPGQQFRVGVTVPEGRRVLILSAAAGGDWVEIGIPKAGVRGWIEAGALEKI